MSGLSAAEHQAQQDAIYTRRAKSVRVCLTEFLNQAAQIESQPEVSIDQFQDCIAAGVAFTGSAIRFIKFVWITS